LGVTLVLAVLGGSYSLLGRAPPRQSDGPKEQITIALLMYPGSCALIVAQAKQFFAGEGLRVTLDTYPNGRAALAAAFQGKADLAASGDIPIMFAAMERHPLSVVATIAMAENDQGIIGRKDKGIGLPASLKGKRIGATLGTSGHFVLDAFLTRQKLAASDVTVRDLQPDELSNALASGDIDAASVWQPYLSALQTQLGGNGALFGSEGIYDTAYALAGTSNYVLAHPETVKKVLRALVRAEQFCRESPDQARDLLADAFKIKADVLKDLWPLYRFDVALEQSLLLALEDTSQWAVKSRLTARRDVPNYLNYIYLDALDAVAPAKVTVIH
jgi:NitT/TauT family transport system substrate-binding protein